MKIIQKLLLFIYLLILAGCNGNLIPPKRCPSSPPNNPILKTESTTLILPLPDFEIKNGTMYNNQTIGYQFKATKGQKLSLEIKKPSELCIWMITPDNEPSEENADLKGQTLSQTGYYLIQLANLKDNEIKYDISIKLSDPVVGVVTPTPSLSPTPIPTPTHRPTPTPRPTSSYRPTPTPIPTPTHRPTPTPIPTPTHRPTPRPTFTHRPTPKSTPKPKGLSQAQALQLVKVWYEEKPKIFGQNYQTQNVKKYTTGQLYDETLVNCDKNSCGGGVGWLKKYRCYYTYNYSDVGKVIGFSQGKNHTKLTVNVKEKYQLHGPRSANCGKPKAYQKNVSYWFSKDRGTWKISKYKVLD